MVISNISQKVCHDTRPINSEKLFSYLQGGWGKNLVGEALQKKHNVTMQLLEARDKIRFFCQDIKSVDAEKRLRSAASDLDLYLDRIESVETETICAPLPASILQQLEDFCDVTVSQSSNKNRRLTDLHVYKLSLYY